MVGEAGWMSSVTGHGPVTMRAPLLATSTSSCEVLWMSEPGRSKSFEEDNLCEPSHRTTPTQTSSLKDMDPECERGGVRSAISSGIHEKRASGFCRQNEPIRAQNTPGTTCCFSPPGGFHFAWELPGDGVQQRLGMSRPTQVEYLQSRVNHRGKTGPGGPNTSRRCEFLALMTHPQPPQPHAGGSQSRFTLHSTSRRLRLHAYAYSPSNLWQPRRNAARWIGEPVTLTQPTRPTVFIIMTRAPASLPCLPHPAPSSRLRHLPTTWLGELLGRSWTV